MITFLLILCLSVRSDGESCDDRTSYFEETRDINTNNQYFNPKTIMKGTYLINSRNQLIDQLLQLGIGCVGKWCIMSNDWGCYSGPSNCYHREHIIPTENKISTLVNCLNMTAYNVRSNQAMSYGKWNIQLSNKYLGEKVSVYGRTTIKTAYDDVYESCFGNKPKNYPPDLCLTNSNDEWLIVLIVFPFVSFLVIGGIIYYVYNYSPLEGSVVDRTAYNFNDKINEVLNPLSSTDSDTELSERI